MRILEWVGGVSTNSPARFATEILVVIEDSSLGFQKILAPVPVVLFAKLPVPGKVKTRLAARVGTEQAAIGARALLLASLRRFSEIPGAPLFLAGDHQRAAAFDSYPILGKRYLWQGEGDLGSRLTRVFAAPPRIPEEAPAPGVIAIGADAPHLNPAVIRAAADTVRQGNFALGPATDGGFYLLGVPCGAVDLAALFPSSGWGEPGVLARTRRVLFEASSPPNAATGPSSETQWRRTLEFGNLCDIDTWEDLVQLRRDWLAEESAGGPGRSCDSASPLKAESFEGLRSAAPELWEFAREAVD